MTKKNCLKKIGKGNNIKAPAGFKFIAYRVVDNVLTHCIQSSR